MLFIGEQEMHLYVTGFPSHLGQAAKIFEAFTGCVHFLENKVNIHEHLFESVRHLLPACTSITTITTSLLTFPALNMT